MEISAQEQYMLELVNRMRMDPAGELNRLVDSLDPIHSDDPDVDAAIDYFNVNGNVLASDWALLTPAAPLAWSLPLHDAALDHSKAMIAADLQSHHLPGEPSLSNRVQNAGYTQFGYIGENVFAFAESVYYGHAGFAIDWGNDKYGLQDPAGHRNNIMNADFEEIGIGIVAENDSRTDVGPLVITQDFGWRYGTADAWLLGVVFDDANADAFYTPGEGLAGVTVAVDSGHGIVTTTSMTAGGYQIAVAPGTYSVTFSGGGLSTSVVRTVSIDADNVKLDVLSPSGAANPNADETLVGGAGPDTLDGQGGNDVVSGLGGDDRLLGGTGTDTLIGGDGNDTLDGGTGVDSMTGGLGNDWFLVDNKSDVVRDAAGEGTLDRVFSSVSYTLAPGAEIERLSTDFHAGTKPIDLTGNEFADYVIGNDGNNVLDGRGGDDVMIGRDGDDWFFVDSFYDVAVDYAGQGSDRVFTNVTYILTPGSEIEVMSTTDHAGTAALNLSGNEFANVIYGNAGNNIIDGRGGADVMVGLGGDDWFLIDNAADRVSEATGGGTDRVFTGVSYVLTPGASVEIMSTDFHAGTGAINLSGNERANTIYGNAGSNVIDGKGGADVLIGFGGFDYFYFDTPLSGGNVDRIADFTVGEDLIALNRAIFSSLPSGALAPDAFHLGALAADSTDRILYEAATGDLAYDPDGTGAAIAQTFAQLSPGLALSSSDFLIL